MSVNGNCDPRFSALRSRLQEFIDSEEELGACICVSIDGKNIVDIWGGFTDPERTQPWHENTLVPVWSISKTITNLAALILVDRGLLDPYAKVSKYWPEFAQNGKEDVEVRHFLSHTSGVPSWETPMATEEIFDVPRATERLAKQAPWWKPGTASGYHLVNQGHLVGELVRRMSGKTLGQFIQDELATPLNADFSLGAPESKWSRIAGIIPPEAYPLPEAPDQTSIAQRAFLGSHPKATDCLTPAFRLTELGGANGFSNARAVNKILSIIALGGEVDGKRFLSQETIDLIFREQANGPDLVLGHVIRFGIGYGLPIPETVPWIPDGKVCFWGGWGGAIAIMDLDKRMTITYNLNKMGPGTLGTERTEAYVREIYKVINETL